MANVTHHILHPRGFTLVELLVVFTLIGLLTIGGVTSFFSYSRDQSFRISISEVSHILNVAKTRAISQVKPSQCGLQALRGYEVLFTVPGSDYQLRALCNSTYYLIQSRKLPANISFQSGSATSVFFAVSTGITTQQRTVTISNSTMSKIITIGTTGNISVQ